MLQRGYHPATKEERKKYGKFVNREGFFSIVIGLMRRLGKGRRNVKQPRVVVVAWQTGEQISPLDRQSQDQSYTRQNEASSTAVFGEQSGQWKRTRLAEPVLQH